MVIYMGIYVDNCVVFFGLIVYGGGMRKVFFNS